MGIGRYEAKKIIFLPKVLPRGVTAQEKAVNNKDWLYWHIFIKNLHKDILNCIQWEFVFKTISKHRCQGFLGFFRTKFSFCQINNLWRNKIRSFLLLIVIIMWSDPDILKSWILIRSSFLFYWTFYTNFL